MTKFLIIIMILCTGCSLQVQHQTDRQGAPRLQFSLPEIPVMINTEKEAAEYLSRHFWDSFDFADTTFLHSEEVEGWFVDYLKVLRIGQCNEEVTTGLLTRIETINRIWISRFMELADQYLADANSTLRNEELYIPFATYAIRSRALEGYVKVRYQQKLGLALKNRVGAQASDFPFYTASGKKGKLSDLTNRKVLLFFNNPTCHECQAVKEELLTSARLQHLIEAKELIVLSVYIDADMDIWKNAVHPAEWHNVYDKGWVTDHSLYNLDAIPTIYLLDEQQQVVAKDATVSEIENML